MDDHGLLARDIALLQKAQGIGANKSFILYFITAAIMVVCTFVGVLAGGAGGIALLVGLAVIGAVARFTPWGENLIIIVVLVMGLITGFFAVWGAVGAILQ